MNCQYRQNNLYWIIKWIPKLWRENATRW